MVQIAAAGIVDLHGEHQSVITPLVRWFDHRFGLVIVYYFCRALDILVSGLDPHSIHLLGYSCLLCLRRVKPCTGLSQNFWTVSLDVCANMQVALTGI